MFYARILLPLQQLSISAEVVWLADLIDCLTSLVQNWAVRDKEEWKVSNPSSILNSYVVHAWSRYLASIADAILLGRSIKRRTMFGELDGDVAYLKCLQTLCEEIDRLATVSLQVRLSFPTSSLYPLTDSNHLSQSSFLDPPRINPDPILRLKFLRAKPRTTTPVWIGSRDCS